MCILTLNFSIITGILWLQITGGGDVYMAACGLHGIKYLLKIIGGYNKHAH